MKSVSKSITIEGVGLSTYADPIDVKKQRASICAAITPKSDLVNLPIGANPRYGHKSSVRQSMVTDLMDSENINFQNNNKGLSIVADSFKVLSENKIKLFFKAVDEGLLDGGTTLYALKEALAAIEPGTKYVDVRIVTGLNDSELLDSAKKLNSNVQVKANSIENMRGSYDSLKKRLGKHKKYVQFSESDVSASIKVQEITMFELAFNPELTNPHMSNPTKKKCIKDIMIAQGTAHRHWLKNVNLINGMSTPAMLESILKLKEFVSFQFRKEALKQYKGKRNVFAEATGSPYLAKGIQRDLFNSDKTYESTVPKGFLLVMLGALGPYISFDSKGKVRFSCSMDKIEKAYTKVMPEFVRLLEDSAIKYREPEKGPVKHSLTPDSFSKEKRNWEIFQTRLAKYL